ncbi:MAG: diguanylate cyclase, partial [Ignavibacteriales bacterium]
MEKINANLLKPGDKLSQDIYTFDNRLLLAKGTVLTSIHLDSFRRMGIDYVFTFDPEDLQKDKPKKFEESYEESLGIVRSCIVEAKLGGSIEHKEISQASGMLFEQALSKTDLFRKI